MRQRMTVRGDRGVAPRRAGHPTARREGQGVACPADLRRSRLIHRPAVRTWLPKGVVRVLYVLDPLHPPIGAFRLRTCSSKRAAFIINPLSKSCALARYTPYRYIGLRIPLGGICVKRALSFLVDGERAARPLSVVCATSPIPTASNRRRTWNSRLRGRIRWRTTRRIEGAGRRTPARRDRRRRRRQARPRCSHGWSCSGPSVRRCSRMGRLSASVTRRRLQVKPNRTALRGCW